MCLVCSWKTELQAIWMTLLLLQWREVGAVIGTPISANNQRNQIISFVVVAIARHSALVEDRETTFGFLLYHEIRDPLEKMQQPVVDLWLVELLAQSTSEYA